MATASGLTVMKATLPVARWRRLATRSVSSGYEGPNAGDHSLPSDGYGVAVPGMTAR